MEEVKHQPDYEYGNEGKPDRKWNAGMAAITRGYAVGQWPQAAIDDFYSQDQKSLLDDLKFYMASGKKPTDAAPPLSLRQSEYRPINDLLDPRRD